MSNVIDILKERGLIEAQTHEELRQHAEKPMKVYCGFDPTSDSLHVGNMVAMMGLAWFQRCGHTPVVIVGGATGMIGDPSGKAAERQLLDEQTLSKNVKGIRANLESFLSFEKGNAKAVILNNYDWFKDFSFINFLRDVGKQFRMGPMLSKDSVKARMTTEEGMSYTEFSYQILQAYDFLYLFDHHQVTLQIGGSDQWGNITAGTELVRKLRGKSVFGLTFPLLVNSEGQKFGKSEKGAVWMSADKLSPYEFYQYFVRVADADVIKLMRMLTFMDMEEIKRFETLMKTPEYIPNTAQKRLAEEVTRIVHGDENLQKALRATSAAAPGAETELNLQALEAISNDIPSHHVTSEHIVNAKLVDLIAQIGLQPSKGEAKRLIRNGGVYVNNRRIEDENCTLNEQDLIGGRMLLLAVGKKNKVLVQVKKS